MHEIRREDSGWVIALAWVSALEETARDFHGTRPQAFCERAYEHTTRNFLSRLELDYGLRAERCESIKGAVAEYIRVGVLGGAFGDSSQFELNEVNPDRLEISVHNCLYLKSCQALRAEGISVRNLTCARIGCFRAAVKQLAGIDCDYEVTAFDLEDTCRGAVESE
jgi:hypothetical protein